MERRLRCWIPLVLLAAWSCVTRGDLYHHMEDAFADDNSDRETTCRRSERTTVCRLGNLQKSAIDKLNTCLCTHLIFQEGSVAISDSLRESNPNLLFLITTPLEVLLTKDDSRTAVEQLVKSIEIGGLDGVDLTIRKEGERPESLSILKELDKQLAGKNTSRKMLHLTFVNSAPPAPFIAEILSQTEVTSFTFFADFAKNESQNLMQLISKLGIPRNRTLLGISLTNFEDKTAMEPFPHQRCSTIPSESNDEEDPFSRGEGEKLQKLREEIEYAEQTVGIDIWSLAYDDVEGLCGKGPFPILRYISQKMNQDPQPFDEFADLDIVLSTGESQELQLLHDLDVTPEEMKKLPCDRVGFYRHPLDCSKFYHCSEFRTTKLNHTGPYAGFLYKCPNGLVYDERQGSCIWASLSDPCTGSGELLPVPAKKFSCVVPGFHADPEDCRWFYYCSDLGDGRLEAFEFLCPSDLLGYDEEKMLCNWKWTVPACVNYGKQPEANIGSVSTPKTPLKNRIQPQDRTPKALKIEGIQTPFTPSLGHTTRKPRRIKVNPRESQGHNAETGEIILATTDEYASTHDDLQQVVTTYSSRNIIDNIEDVRMANNSSSQERFTNERQNLPERKYGTAVWRRSWVNDRLPNHRTVTSQISTSDIILSNNRINKRRLNNGENNQHSNGNNLEINVKDRRVPSPETHNEPERFFKGVVRKINTDGQIDQTFELRNKGEKNIERGMSTRVRNPQEFPELEKQNRRDNTDGNTFYNIPNEELDRDTQTFSAQNRSKNAPFVNVKCSKLQNGNNQPEDIGSFGCTSEVSLTIHIRRGKDPSKYTLREDKITRTALQESQQIPYVETPRTTNTNNLSSNANKRQQRIDSPTLFLSPESKIKRNESSILSEKTDRSSDTFILEASSFATTKGTGEMYKTKLNGSSDIASQEHFAASSLTKSRESYDVRTPNIYDKLQQNTSAHSKHRNLKLIEENSTKVLNNTNSEQRTSKKNFDSIKSLPIHFYPQGVLLNIDITHINEIPPQILLEVDEMLKTYMNDGNIDLNLLGRKLNASTESMSEKENMEPEEIVEMIHVIQNIINSSREREIVTTEINPSSTGAEDSTINQTEIYNDTVSETNEDVDYENISLSTKNISDKYLINDQSTDMNGPNIQQTNDKIQNSEISLNNSETDKSNQKPFGRRRLLRKFRYPSIREQLERQNKFRSAQQAVYNVSRPETESGVINRSDTTSYTPKRDETIFDQTDRGQNLNLNKQSAVIHTISPKIDENNSQPLIRQYGDRRTASEQQGTPREETYRHSSFHHTLTNRAENKVLRPPSVQYENSQAQTWENRRTFEGDTYVYPPVKVALPITTSKDIETGNSRTPEKDSGNFEIGAFRDDTYKHSLDNQALSYNAQQNGALQPSSLQHGNQAQTWEHRKTSQYDTYLYASLKPTSVTATYDENIYIQNSRPLEKDTGNFEIRSFQDENYKHSPVNPALPRTAQKNNARRPPILQYGDRTKVSENRRFHDETYVHSSFKLTSSSPDGNTETGNSRGVQENIERFERTNGNYNLPTNIPQASNFQRENHFTYNHEHNKSKVETTFSVTSDNQDFYNTKSENIPLSVRNEAERSFDYRQSEQSIQTRGKQAANSGFANADGGNVDTNAVQARKKRKLRILVRKLADSASVPRHESVPMNIEKNDLQQKISKNVLNALKSRFLQKHTKDGADDIELQIQYQGHVWNIPFVNSENEAALSPAVCTRPGLFQHPRDCNMFYECFWDKWLQRFTLHVFSCPVKLVYDENVRGCNRPSTDSPCRNFTT